MTTKITIDDLPASIPIINAYNKELDEEIRKEAL